MPPEAMGGGRNAPVMPELSGKMFVLWRLMREMRKPGNGADVSISSSFTTVHEAPHFLIFHCFVKYLFL
jgi:hypothetical protein